MNRLKGKKIAVVGAGSIGPGWGNGKAAAVSFAREGAHVLCIDRQGEAAKETVAAIHAENGSASALELDAITPEAADTMMLAMNGRLGGIDILHFNIGISEKGGIGETSDEAWSRVFDVNLKSAFRFTRAVLPHMRLQGSGGLIYVSSIAAVVSGPYSYTSYEVSKAALCRMMRSVARENAPHGIRANAILPGAIDTPHVKRYVSGGMDPAELAKKRAAMVPLGRQGTSWDIANAAVFLASEESSFITGIELRVDGGMSA